MTNQLSLDCIYQIALLSHPLEVNKLASLSREMHLLLGNGFWRAKYREDFGINIPIDVVGIKDTYLHRFAGYRKLSAKDGVTYFIRNGDLIEWPKYNVISRSKPNDIYIHISHSKEYCNILRKSGDIISISTSNTVYQCEPKEEKCKYITTGNYSSIIVTKKNKIKTYGPPYYGTIFKNFEYSIKTICSASFILCLFENGMVILLHNMDMMPPRFLSLPHMKFIQISASNRTYIGITTLHNLYLFDSDGILDPVLLKEQVSDVAIMHDQYLIYPIIVVLTLSGSVEYKNRKEKWIHIWQSSENDLLIEISLARHGLFGLTIRENIVVIDSDLVHRVEQELYESMRTKI